MPKYYLFTIDGCGTCEDVRAKLEGAEVEEVRVTPEWLESEDGHRMIERLKGAGIGFDAAPQCVVVKDDDSMALCDTRRMPDFVPKRQAAP